MRRKVHQTLDSITHDFEQFEFNTIISSLMELTNSMSDALDKGANGSFSWQEAVDYLLRMMAPVVPHIAEELWERLGKPYSIHQQAWPKFEMEIAKEDEITLAVQVNGKLRDHIIVPIDIREEEAKEMALASEGAINYLHGRQPRKVIYVPGRLINIVV